MTLNLIFTVAFVSVLVYLLMFFQFIRRFPKLYPEIWRHLDCPESFGLRGQATYLAIVLGFEKKAPLRDLSEVFKEVVGIRIALGVALVAFIAVAIITS